MRLLPRTLAIVATATILASAVAPVAAAHRLFGADPYLASVSGGVSTTAIKAPCQDGAYSLIGGSWNQTVHWTFNSASTPASLTVDVAEAALVRSFDNITSENNDCGRPDTVSAKHAYDGRAVRAPNVSKSGYCTASDGKNAVGFGRLPFGILAVTCVMTTGNRIVESDIRINTRFQWAATVGECNHEELLEPTITHEVGHVFGLGHVSERRHPLLTMSTISDGQCNNAATTLGKGDMLGLEALY